jgi:hypothetical protein
VRQRLLAVVCIAIALPLSAQAKLASDASSRIAARSASSAAPPPSRYLYVWSSTMDTTRAAVRPYDFLAVVDLQPDDSTTGSRYGHVARLVPVPARNTMAHHAEQHFVEGRHFFTSGFHSGQLFLFDTKAHAEPRFIRVMDSVPGFVTPHSLVPLSNGHVLATVQFSRDSAGGRPGGLAELDDNGSVLRTSSAADSAFRGAHIRPYGIEVVPSLDRVVTTSSPMDDEHTTFVVQVWRLSDLHLLRSFLLPASADSANTYPFEPRVLADGRTVLVNSYTCGLYRITALETSHPSAELVLSLSQPGAGMQGCAVPSVVGHYWVMPIVYQHRVAVLDVSNPDHPREVSSLACDSAFFPHWSSADPASDRIVITEQGDGAPRVLIARLDSRTGALTWDERFREQGATRPGLDFERVEGPHGVIAAAMPHASVFVP